MSIKYTSKHGFNLIVFSKKKCITCKSTKNFLSFPEHIFSTQLEYDFPLMANCWGEYFFKSEICYFL